MRGLESQTNIVPHSVLAVGQEKNNFGECFNPFFATARNNFMRLCFVETAVVLKKHLRNVPLSCLWTLCLDRYQQNADLAKFSLV